jgi:RNA polymerase sigma-70 factor, ECF subfamily
MARWAQLDLVSRATHGDPGAVEDLIAAIWPRCFRLAISVIGDRSLAQDAAQEACVIVHRKVRTLRAFEAFDAWLYRIVMRESVRVRRRTPLLEPYAGAAMTDDGTVAIDVWRSLAALSPELRDVTVLFYFDDLKTEEISRILGVAHATVRTRLNRARERLRGLLEDYAETSAPSLREIKHYAV